MSEANDEELVPVSRLNKLMGTMNARTRERDTALAEAAALREQLAGYGHNDETDIYAEPTIASESNPSEGDAAEEQPQDREDREVEVVSDLAFHALTHPVAGLVQTGDGRVIISSSTHRKMNSDSQPENDLSRARRSFEQAAMEMEDLYREQS